MWLWVGVFKRLGDEYFSLVIIIIIVCTELCRRGVLDVLLYTPRAVIIMLDR